jgi:endo-1,4-beta-xylanase
VIHQVKHVTTRAPLVVKLSHDATAVGIALQARGAGCNAQRPLKLVLSVDKRKMITARLDTGRFRQLSANSPLKAGRHTVRIKLSGGRRGCNTAAVDELRLVLTLTPGGTPLGPHRHIPLATAFTSSPAERFGASGDLFRTSFDGLTPENAMKMTYVETARGTYHFETPDAIVDYARSLGKSVHGHPLVWHTQLPGWVLNAKWSKDDLEAVMHEWISAIVTHFKGRVDEWDVVNEPLADDGTLRPSIWAKVIGPDYIPLALKWAHEADPSAKLFINEYDDDLAGPKSTALLALVRDLRKQGAPLDGIGIQGHWSLQQPPIDEPTLRAVVRSYAAAGMLIEFTETDVVTDGTPFSQIAQADEFAKAARVCQSLAACIRFTVWGLDDNMSWRGVGSAATLFDRNYAPKPAYVATKAALDAG